MYDKMSHALIITQVYDVNSYYKVFLFLFMTIKG